jgi:hypothetical protein
MCLVAATMKRGHSFSGYYAVTAKRKKRNDLLPLVSSQKRPSLEVIQERVAYLFMSIHLYLPTLFFTYQLYFLLTIFIFYLPTLFFANTVIFWLRAPGRPG